MKNHLILIRDKKNPDSTGGELYIEAKKFCETLEDPVRAFGIKIPKQTAIPDGVYKWKVTFSNRFQRDTILIYNQDDLSIVAGGISFSGVRMHGGNTAEDTEGCPLVAYTEVAANRIWKTAEKDLTNWAKIVGGSGYITIINKF